MHSISTEEKLRERIKELSCLYDISSVMGENLPAAETLEKVCFILKSAWRFSGKAIVELKTVDHHITTSAVPKKSIYQDSHILSGKEKIGFIKVHYPSHEGKSLFLPEEQKLLDQVALEVADFLEKDENRKKEELLKRRAERNDRLSILGEITAGIAHELNTPLGNILGFAELIDQRTSDQQIKKDIQKIIKASIFSREVVKKLMFFSCEMPQNMEFIKVEPIVSQALSLLGQNFKKAEVTYSLSSKVPDLEAQLDSIQFTQVLFNILINAIYAAPINSRIDIRLFQNDSESFYIEIADEGPGIPTEIRPKIFEPFFTTKPIGVGSGLGLSVVHGIIKSHKGSIVSFDNEPKGTVFQIHLPVKM